MKAILLFETLLRKKTNRTNWRICLRLQTLRQQLPREKPERIFSDDFHGAFFPTFRFFQKCRGFNNFFLFLRGQIGRNGQGTAKVERGKGQSGFRRRKEVQKEVVQGKGKTIIVLIIIINHDYLNAFKLF